jgi:hypothetical protein
MYQQEDHQNQDVPLLLKRIGSSVGTNTNEESSICIPTESLSYVITKNTSLANSLLLPTFSSSTLIKPYEIESVEPITSNSHQSRCSLTSTHHKSFSQLGDRIAALKSQVCKLSHEFETKSVSDGTRMGNVTLLDVDSSMFVPHANPINP